MSGWIKFGFLVMALMLPASISFSQDEVQTKKKRKKLIEKRVVKKKAGFREKDSKVKIGVSGKKGEAIVSQESTEFDFEDGKIEGRVKAPDGFFLRGRKSQDLMQTVKLRDDFRGELKATKNGVKALTH